MYFFLILFYCWLPCLAACTSDGGDSDLFHAWLWETSLTQELLGWDTCDLWVPSLLPAMNVGLLKYGCFIWSQRWK